MSQDMIQVSASLPAYLQQQKLVYKDSGLGAGIAARAPKLGVSTDKRFTLNKDGTKTFLTDKVRAVLVASASSITKAWYANGYTPGSTDAPDCFSLDAKVPAPGCAQPQSTNCATCKKNAFGSNTQTGRGKACADRKMVVLVWEGEPDTLMTMNFPTMSMNALKSLDIKMREANIPLQAVLVEMSFDPMFTYPVLKLNPVGFVDEATATRLMEAADSQEVAELLRDTESEHATADAPAKPEPVVPDTVVQFGAVAAAQVEVEAPKQRKPRAKAAPTVQEVDSAIQDALEAYAKEEPMAVLVDPDTGKTSKPATGGIDVMALVNAWKSK